MKYRIPIIVLSLILVGFGYADHSNTWGLKFKNKFLYSDFEFRDYFKDSTCTISLSDYLKTDTLSYYFFTCPVRTMGNPTTLINFADQNGKDRPELRFETTNNDYMAYLTIDQLSKLKIDSTYIMTMDIKEFADKKKDDRNSKPVFSYAFPIRLKLIK